jgi:hypothetical protein
MEMDSHTNPRRTEENPAKKGEAATRRTTLPCGQSTVATCASSPWPSEVSRMRIDAAANTFIIPTKKKKKKNWPRRYNVQLMRFMFEILKKKTKLTNILNFITHVWNLHNNENVDLN